MVKKPLGGADSAPPPLDWIGLTPEGISLRKLHEDIRGGRSIGPLSSTFDTKYPID